MVKKFKYNHIVRDYYTVAEALGLACEPIPRLKAMAVEHHHMKRSLCIHIGADNEKRRIPVTLILNIIAYAESSGIRVRLIGTETDLAGQILKLANGYPEYQSGDLASVNQWLKHSELVIAPDSGILHLAAALDKPCIALYGPNTFSRSGPLSNKVAVIELDYDCRPCIQKNPCRYNVRCMNQIRFDAVRREMDRFLSGARIM